MKMLVFLGFVLLIILILFGYFFKKNKQVFDYSFQSPVFQQYLAKDLKEISGISYYAENQVICVNDENGKLFIYDFEKQAIIDTLDFDDAGDYEAVEFVNNTAYVLQSNGHLKAFDLQTKTTKTFDCRQEDVEEFEGLGYDSKSNSLLLAAKEMKNDKTIFAFNIISEQMSRKFSISKKDIKSNAKNGKEFKPSGIAVHPTSNDIYVLASAGKKLLVFTENGKIKQQYNLNEDQFPQPEGICFTPKGDLIIASEGKNGKACILMFKYEPKK